MVQEDLATEIVTDLLRSAWIVERARREVYLGWAQEDNRFEQSAQRCGHRADIVAAALGRRGRAPDEDLVQAHASWIRSLVGTDLGEVALGDLFVARLGDWVEAHAAPFIDDRESDLRSLGEQERASLVWPESLPPVPGFEPLAAPDVEPPGPVRFSFGILADLHVGSREGDALVEAAISDLNQSGVALVIQLGDITDHGDKDEWERAGEILGRLEMPVATMLGNHDIYSLKEARLSGRDYYSASSFGRESDGVLIEHDGIRFAVLDSAEHGASPFAAFNLITGTFDEGSGGAVVRGSLTPPQHEILAEIAAPGSGPAFVFLHHPPQPFTSFPPVLFGLRDQDSGRLHATADSGNVWGVFAGHTHRNALTRRYGTVPAQEVAIPRDFPCGYALVDVTERGYAFRFLQVSDEALLKEGYERAGEIHRRYAAGRFEERAFVWKSPQ
jgi:predicted phosphodiesterase